MNWSLPSVWNLIGHIIAILAVIFGWMKVYGHNKEEWGKIRQEVTTNSGRLVKLECVMPEKLSTKDAFTFQEHDSVCADHIGRVTTDMGKLIEAHEKNTDLKLAALKGDLILALNGIVKQKS